MREGEAGVRVGNWGQSALLPCETTSVFETTGATQWGRFTGRAIGARGRWGRSLAREAADLELDCGADVVPAPCELLLHARADRFEFVTRLRAALQLP